MHGVGEIIIQSRSRVFGFDQMSSSITRSQVRSCNAWCYGSINGMSETIWVYGYHGTSMERALAIVEAGFKPSNNEYDWLGRGIYFWQDAPKRAWQWAQSNYPDNPAVVKSRLKLDPSCLDLLDIGYSPLLRTMYNGFISSYQKQNLSLPQHNPDRSKAHRLDCLFFNYVVSTFNNTSDKRIISVRSAFVEGDRIFPTSAIYDLTHVQIAILDSNLIEELCILTMDDM